MSDKDQGEKKGPQRGTPWSGLQDEPRTTPLRPISAREVKVLGEGSSSENRFQKAFDQSMVTDEDVLAYIMLFVELGYVTKEGYADLDAVCEWTGYFKSPVQNRPVHPNLLTVKEMRDIVTKDMQGPNGPGRRVAPAEVKKPGMAARLASRVKNLGREL